MNTELKRSDRILRCRDGDITHEQVGKIVLLAGEVSMNEFKKACEWVCFNHDQKEAEMYIDSLSKKINNDNNSKN